MNNYGFISKKKVAREIAKIYNSHSATREDERMFYMDCGACSSLNLLCTNLKIKPMHRNKLGGGTGEMCGEKKSEQVDKVTFNIKVTMNERWVNDFCSMLKWMESCGNLGHSSLIGFYADGDGDFRPKFKIDREFEKTHGIWQHERTAKQEPLPRPEVIYDAG